MYVFTVISCLFVKALPLALLSTASTASRNKYRFYNFDDYGEDGSTFKNGGCKENESLNDLSESYSTCSFVLITKAQYKNLKSLNKRKKKLKTYLDDKDSFESNADEKFQYQVNECSKPSEKLNNNIPSNNLKKSHRISTAQQLFNRVDKQPQTDKIFPNKTIFSDWDDDYSVRSTNLKLDPNYTKKSVYPSSTAVFGLHSEIQSNAPRFEKPFEASRPSCQKDSYKSNIPDKCNADPMQSDSFSKEAHKEYTYEVERNYNATYSKPNKKKISPKMPNLLEEESNTLLPRLTPIPKPNYIEDLKQELLKSLKTKPDLNNYKILSPYYDDCKGNNCCQNTGQKGIQTECSACNSCPCAPDSMQSLQDCQYINSYEHNTLPLPRAELHEDIISCTPSECSAFDCSEIQQSSIIYSSLGISEEYCCSNKEMKSPNNNCCENRNISYKCIQDTNDYCCCMNTDTNVQRRSSDDICYCDDPISANCNNQYDSMCSIDKDRTEARDRNPCNVQSRSSDNVCCCDETISTICKSKYESICLQDKDRTQGRDNVQSRSSDDICCSDQAFSTNCNNKYGNICLQDKDRFEARERNACKTLEGSKQCKKTGAGATECRRNDYGMQTCSRSTCDNSKSTCCYQCYPVKQLTNQQEYHSKQVPYSPQTCCPSQSTCPRYSALLTAKNCIGSTQKPNNCKDKPILNLKYESDRPLCCQKPVNIVIEKCKKRGKLKRDYDKCPKIRTDKFSQSGAIMTNENGIDKDAVRVAVRIRPQNSRELIDMCRNCTTTTPDEPQIILGEDKAFTFDYVFDIQSDQANVYSSCVEKLVEGALKGYNATVLAYGQTGSGKTFTMGTGFEHDIKDQEGIIPRAVHQIFLGIEKIQSEEYDHTKNKFSVSAQFIELYNEEIIDLLDPYNKSKVLKIHEDGNGQISVSGVTVKTVVTTQDAIKYLQQGALARTTASTKMNDQSSRSHALFTIFIRRQKLLSMEESGCPEGDFETLTSKFHFVDLAGSERLKRTGATGERAREGISINCGLLALGNCISALGDKSKKATHIPYRDSKLTRLLQDSLGGNSQTVMIACISPSDRDFMETLNTLKYANRARNIKNKVLLNQDQSSRTISQLRKEIASLQIELLEYKQGKLQMDCEGNPVISDTYQENMMLSAENKRLQQRLKALQETVNVLTEKNTQLIVEKSAHNWSSSSIDNNDTITNLIAGYLKEIEILQTKLIESEAMNQQIKKTSGNVSISHPLDLKSKLVDPESIIDLAKRDIKRNQELLIEQGPDEENGEIISTSYCFSDDSDGEEKSNELHGNLDDINADIQIKTKLIEQLELSQKRLQLLKQQYEEKLSLLSFKIKNTQKERDEVLAHMNSKQSSTNTDNHKKVREEYEGKLSEMRRELKKLQLCQRENIRQQREVKMQEMKIDKLRIELNELKCIKTRLMRKIAEQSNLHREEDFRKKREIAQLRKEQLKQLNTMRSLQAQVNIKEQILKRRTEEVSLLRRSQRNASLKRARSGGKTFNLNQFQKYWENIIRDILNASRNRQAIGHLERELKRLITERENVCQDLENNHKHSMPNIDSVSDEDTIKSGLSYIQSNIKQIQQAILELEESDSSIGSITEKLQNQFEKINNIEEAKLLLQHFVDAAIAYASNQAISENNLLEQRALLNEIQHEHSIQRQLLDYFISQTDALDISNILDSFNLYDNNQNSDHMSDSKISIQSNETFNIPFESISNRNILSRSSSPILGGTVDLSNEKNGKIRRRTAQPKDLLFEDSQTVPHYNMATSDIAAGPHNSLTYPLIRVPSAPSSLK